MRIGCLLLAVAASRSAAVGGETWAQRLGYPADERAVILSMGKAGLCHETNAAVFQALESGRATSAEVMPPAPWFSSFARWARQRQDLDVGVSLTLVSENETVSYGPVAAGHVRGLLDEDGRLPVSMHRVATSAPVEAIEIEARAQIERCLRAGLRPSHLSPHKGFLFLNQDLAAVYLKLAQEYWIPAVVVELTPEMLDAFRQAGFPMEQGLIDLIQAYPLPKLDHLELVAQAPSYEEKREHLLGQLRGLPPGLTQLVFQPAEESEALKAMTPQWQQHVWDAALLADEQVRRTLEEENISLTNWREVMQRFDPESTATDNDE